MAVCEGSAEDKFFGSVTVGERGQIVIPAEARKRLNIVAGDKLLVIGHPQTHGLLFCRMDMFRQFLNKFVEGLDKLQELEVKGEPGEK